MLVSSLALARAQTNSSPQLQAELVAPLDIRRIKVSQPVPLRVLASWSDAQCALHPGSIILGHVVAFTRRGAGVPDSQVQLAFNAVGCPASAESFPLTLAALISAPPQTPQVNGGRQTEYVFNPFSNRTATSSAMLRVERDAPPPSARPTPSLPAHIAPGEVIGLKKTTLSVASGVDQASVVTAVGHELHLEPGTRLILIDNAPNRPSNLAGNVTRENPAARPAKTPPPPEPPDETDLCTGVCTTVEPSTQQSATRITGRTILELKPFGFSPRERHERYGFDADESLTYLDDNNLLLTFDPHQLRERVGGQQSVRHIRALLIDPQTRTVRKYTEWRVPGDEQYLWRLPGNRILVHIGAELRVLDSALHPLHAIRLSGPLAWAVVSPGADHIAIGTLRERYSPAVKGELTAALGKEPEEDIEVQVIDDSNKPVFTAIRSSSMPPPVLSDSGVLRLQRDGSSRWKLIERTWTGSEHTITTTRSSCQPTLSVPMHDRIFLVGCTSSVLHWYRMLRPDGHPLLKGLPLSTEFQMQAEAATADAFAIRAVSTSQLMAEGRPFTRSDLLQERVSLYRSSSGSALATITTDDFALSDMSYSIAPSGDRAALLGSHSISFYAIKPRSE